ncbi:flagellar basal-body rod protein FlgF [Chitinilyticum piscinae]|uniref:Flagellar basal-body rod protein FlgF n=1 Tax=Chitinilyticum piscinae TaxID=2866724 RepID=A0A8J7K971_9NEIS|nr:flagellar basal-body rod protein FlgF [Chitinilyticum piscinae]MBE9610768.1 flagellar basal-body rod protein FlgF [Chitinilyticum piscinae]
MDRLLYVAMTGAKHTQLRQATVAHNLANASTTGFRAELAAFRAVPALGQGYATRAFAVEQTTGADLSSGPFQQTGNDLDVSIDGRGWIAVQSATGEAYTRNGQFAVDSTGLLKTVSGLVVQGETGPLLIPENTRPSIAPDGTVSAVSLDNPAESNEIGRIKLVNPADTDLQKGNDGLFRLRGGDAAQADAAVKLINGGLEGSNVNTIDQLTAMIATQRQYDLQVRMMQAADQNARAASQLLQMNS